MFLCHSFPKKALHWSCLTWFFPSGSTWGLKTGMDWNLIFHHFPLKTARPTAGPASGSSAQRSSESVEAAREAVLRFLGASSSEYEVVARRSPETGRLFGVIFAWDSLDLFDDIWWYLMIFTYTWITWDDFLRCVPNVSTCPESHWLLVLRCEVLLHLQVFTRSCTDSLHLIADMCLGSPGCSYERLALPTANSARSCEVLLTIVV